MNAFDLYDGPTWHARANCHPDTGHDPALWFPDAPFGGGIAKRARAVAPAIAICRTCPVRDRCLADAIDRRADSGIWGGVDFEGTPRGKPAAPTCRRGHPTTDENRRADGRCRLCAVANERARRAQGRRPAA